MKTTRRGFLKGVGVSVTALVAGIRPKLDELPPAEKEENPENSEIFQEVSEVVEVEVPEAARSGSHTTGGYCGKNYDGGIVIDGVPYSGSFSLSFEQDMNSYRLWGTDQMLYARGLSEGYADLQLFVDDVVTLPMYADHCKLELKSDYCFECDARIERIEYHKDVPIVNVELSCWNMVVNYEYA